MRKLKFFVSTFVFLFLLISILAAQDFLICSDCGQVNDIDNKYCFACGESLDDEYQEWLLNKNKEIMRDKKFISNRVDPSRLFSVPTANVLGSKDIRLIGGGAFGVATSSSFLGTIGLGLGDIAEVEFSTVGLVNNLTQASPSVPTSAFKLKLVPENFLGLSFFPMLSIGIRSSANWSDVQSERSMILQNSEWVMDDIASIGYNTRFTTLYGVTSIKLGRLSLHGGLDLTDVRVRDTSVKYNFNSSYYDPNEKQKNLIGGFAGFDFESNPQTKIMFEVKTISNYRFNVGKNEIEVENGYLAIGGIRFFFTKWFSIDTGVWYQSNYKGIADSQIRLGLNLFIPGGSIAKIPAAITHEKEKE